MWDGKNHSPQSDVLDGNLQLQQVRVSQMRVSL